MPSYVFVFAVTNAEGNMTRLLSTGASEKDALLKMVIDNWDLIKKRGTIDLYGAMEGGQ